MSEWISVKDREPPKDGTAVLLCWGINADGESINYLEEPETAGVFVQVASFNGDQWIVYCDMVLDPTLHFIPTHWRPLPPPPEQESE